MPVHTGSDTKGKFYQWGSHGKKYYYTTERSKQIAFKKAQRQGIAIYASGYRDK